MVRQWIKKRLYTKMTRTMNTFMRMDSTRVRMEEMAQRLVCRPVQGMHMTRTLCVVKRKDRRMTAEESAWIETVRSLSV